MTPAFNVVIPARHASTRLPGKVLRQLDGRSMIEHVCRVAQGSGAARIIVATDDDRVATAVKDFGGEACLTSRDHASGTDRVNEVAHREGWKDDVVVVNLQGDEPLMLPALVTQVARELHAHSAAQIGTIAGPFDTVDEWRDPNIVKVLRDAEGYAVYFSRAPIPWDRDGFAAGTPSLPEAAWRHIGLYAYRVGALRRFSALAPPAIERIEALEQLRALHHGWRIFVGIAEQRPGPGVDTEADLVRVEELLKARSRA